MSTFENKIIWLKEYVDVNTNQFNILDENFVDSFVSKFKCKEIIMMYGANKCPSLNRFLSEAYKRGYLQRGTIGIPHLRGYGFPKWVYAYSLREEYQF